MTSYSLIIFGPQEGVENELKSLIEDLQMRSIRDEKFGLYIFNSVLLINEIEDYLKILGHQFIFFKTDKTSYGAHLNNPDYQNNLLELILEANDEPETLKGKVINIVTRLNFAEEMIKYMEQDNAYEIGTPIPDLSLTFEDLFDKMANVGYDKLTEYEKTKLKGFVK